MGTGQMRRAGGTRRLGGFGPCVVVCLLVVSSWGASPLCAEGRAPWRVRILAAKEGRAGEVVRGFEEGLAEAGVGTTEVTSAAALVFAVGIEALDDALRCGRRPVVASYVLDAKRLRGNPGVTGVHLRHDPLRQLELIRRLFPRRRRLGLVCGPDVLGVGEAERLVEAARALDFALEIHVLHGLDELASVLRLVGRRAEILWGLPDPLVYTAGTARTILRFSLLQRIPLVAPSPTWVRAGATAGLDWDLHDLGRQCADMALRVLRKGARDGLPAPEAPRTLRWDVNERSCAYLRLQLPVCPR